MVHQLHDFIDEIRLFIRNIQLLGVDYFIIRIRGLRHLGLFFIIRRVFIILISILLISLISTWLFQYLYSRLWAGFGPSRIPESGINPAKTLWDWMEIALIPILLAVIAYYFRKSFENASMEQLIETNRTDALSGYINFIQDLLQTIDWDDDDNITTASKISTARTITLLHTLDVDRKQMLLKFLYDAELILGNQSFIDLAWTDFSEIIFHHKNLSRSNLRGIKLDSAYLEWTSLYDATLSGASLVNARMGSASLDRANLEYAILEKADFYMANLTEASLGKAHAKKVNFSRANLRRAFMGSVDFTGANFRGAKLQGAYLEGAKLVHVNLSQADLRDANLHEANLMYSNLKGAILDNADLTNAIISFEQLRKVRSAKGAKITGIRDRLGPPMSLKEHRTYWETELQRLSSPTDEQDLPDTEAR